MERQDKCDMKSLVNVCNNVLSISEGDHLTLDCLMLDHTNHHLAKMMSFVCSSHPCDSPYGGEVAAGGTYCYPNPQYLGLKMRGWTAVAERRQEGVAVGRAAEESLAARASAAANVVEL